MKLCCDLYVRISMRDVNCVSIMVFTREKSF